MPDAEEHNGMSKVTLYRLKERQTLDFVKEKLTRPVEQYKFVSNSNSGSLEYSLFWGSSVEMTPKWATFFLSNVSTTTEIQLPRVKSAGFILFVNSVTATYACTGGGGYHVLINNFALESRFGIDIAKKILSKEELKGLAQKDASGNINSLDRVFRGQYNPNGDIDNLHRVLTILRAKKIKGTQLYTEIGSSIKAGDSLSVTGKKGFDQILTFVKKVDELWDSASGNSLDIPELEPISPKLDKNLIETLWKNLVDYILSIDDDKVKVLFLDNLDVGFLPDQTESYYVIYKRSYECSTYEDVFFKVKELLESIAPEERYLEFHKISLQMKPLDQEEHSARKKLTHYICGDIAYEDETYFLNGENWYRANPGFITKIDEELNEITCIPPEDLSLNIWTQKDEDRYNKSHSGLIILDKRLVEIDGENGKIEFCDLLKTTNDSRFDLIHVKNASGAELRALFAQGFVSAQLFAESKEFKDRVFAGQVTHTLDLTPVEEQRYYELKDKKTRTAAEKTEFESFKDKPRKALLPNEIVKLGTLSGKSRNLFWIVYAIFDPSHTVSASATTTTTIFDGTISLFAKIDLLSRVQALRALGYNVALTRIKPYRP